MLNYLRAGTQKMTDDNKVELSRIDTGGDGDVVLLVHGIMMSKDVWYKQVDFLSNDFRVVALDLYGFGESSGPFRDSSNQDHAEDLKSLLDEININSAHVLGWSMGGAVAMVFAQLYPSYVKSLVLVDTTPMLVATEDFPDALKPDMAAELVESILNPPHYGISDFVSAMFPEKNIRKEIERVTKIVKGTDMQVAATHFANSGQSDLRGLLSSISVPTLIVHGALDNVCHCNVAEYMMARIQNSQMHLIQEAGHAPFLTRPEEFNEQVIRFLTTSAT